MEKANVTLYTVIGDPNRIVKAIQERFKEMAEELVCEDETVDLTLPDGTHVIFSIKHRRSKPDFIASHTSGMANYFSQVKTLLAELKENVLCQIRVFNCVTGITFDLNDNEDRTNYILNRLFEIAGDVNGFRSIRACRSLPVKENFSSLQRRKPVDRVYPGRECRFSGREPPGRNSGRCGKTFAFYRVA